MSCTCAIPKAMLNDPISCLYEIFFVYNDNFSRCYQPLNMRLGDRGYKHYILWHIKFQWASISGQVSTSECFLQHCCNSVISWQVYMQVRKKKTRQMLTVNEPANNPIKKDSCLKSQHQQAGISGCFANALGSASCSSSWSFTCSPALRVHYFYPGLAVEHLV